jgi:hypothetical protein
MEGVAVIAASPLQLACLEKESAMSAYTWLGLQRMSYGSKSFMVPGCTCHRFIYGGRICSGVHDDHHQHPQQQCLKLPHLGYEKGPGCCQCCSSSALNRGHHLLPIATFQWWLYQYIDPGMVAMAARWIVATSKDGGHPCHQFSSHWGDAIGCVFAGSSVLQLRQQGCSSLDCGDCCWQLRQCDGCTKMYSTGFLNFVIFMFSFIWYKNTQPFFLLFCSIQPFSKFSLFFSVHCSCFYVLSL